ncbi:MAG: hypothetical protein SGILL_000150, partial [Bacillariaceae sp.]
SVVSSSTTTLAATAATTIMEIDATVAAVASMEDDSSNGAVAVAVAVATSTLNLKTCSAQELMTTLVSARGKEAALELLQQAIDSDGVDDVGVGGDTTTATTTTTTTTPTTAAVVVDLGDALLAQPFETSILTPRLGKCHIQLHERGLTATKVSSDAANSSSSKLTVEASNISHLLVFPKPEDCKLLVQQNALSNDAKRKKLTGCLVLLRLKEAMEIPANNNKKKKCQQLCFSLPVEKKIGPIGPTLAGETSINDDSDVEMITQQWCDVLKKALVLSRVSTTSGGMPFISCYMGVNDGVLYPLKEGLLFYKPIVFQPRSQLESIACGRGNNQSSSSSSRYVDMVVQAAAAASDNTKDKVETIEFTNIRREENGVLNNYIHKVLIPAMQADANNDASNSSNNNDGENGEEVEVEAEAVAVDGDDDETEDEESAADEDGDNDDDDDDDEDFAEDEEVDENASGSDTDDSDDDHDGEFQVVRDEFASELVKEKRKKQDDRSATESEDDGDEDKPRLSKRLRQQG